MPLLVIKLLRGLTWLMKTKLGYFFVAALAWLGINFSTMKIVLQPTIDLLTGYAQGSAGTGGTSEYWIVATNWMGVLQFDKALTMVISAYVTRNLLLNMRLYAFKTGVGA